MLTKKKAKKIFIFQQRNWCLRIGHDLAKHFVKMGNEVSCLTFRKDIFKFITKQKDVKYNLILNHDDIIQNPEKYIKKKISTKEVCKSLNLRSIWPLAQSLRDHAKSYKKKYFYSFQQNKSDEEIINYFKALYFVLETIKREFNPNVILMPNYVSGVHQLFYYFAKKNNIRTIAVTSQLIEKRNFFTYDPTDSSGPVFSKFNKVKSLISRSKTKFFTKKYINKIKKKKIKLKFDLFAESKFFLRRLFFFTIEVFKFKGNFFLLAKNKNITPDNYILYFIIRDFYSKIKNKIFYNKINFTNIDNIESFIYMPLQFQPEANIDVTAPFFNNQIETARQIALRLQGNDTLVVKDHPDMYGFRSNSYLNKILNTPNIKLVKSDISTYKLLKSCKCMVAPTGTTFFEAALLQTPAVLLGNLGFAKILPNVYFNNNIQDVATSIKLAIKQTKIDKLKYSKKLEFIISHLLNNSFDENYNIIWEKGHKNNKNLKNILNIFYKEINF